MSAFPVRRGPAQLLTVLVLALAPAATAHAQLAVPAAVPAASAPVGGATPCAPAPAPVAIACLLNRERAANGLPGLHASRALRRAAASFARAMVSGQFFDHVSPGGSTVRSRVGRTAYLRGARRWSLGENIAYGTGDSGSPVAIVAEWMQSPPHRANILNRSFSDIGVGIAAGVPTGDPTGATYVTDFGRRG